MNSTDQGKPARVAVLESDEPQHRELLEARLSDLAYQNIERFAAADRDKFNDAICAGGYDCVLIADMRALLDGIWNGDFELAMWLSAGVRIELADPAFSEADTTRTALDAFYRSVAEWRVEQRLKKRVAATILSIAALLALAILFLLL